MYFEETKKSFLCVRHFEELTKEFSAHFFNAYLIGRKKLPLRIVTFSITTLSIVTINMTINKSDTQHSNTTHNK
jgi:hypothetical protein